MPNNYMETRFFLKFNDKLVVMFYWQTKHSIPLHIPTIAGKLIEHLVNCHRLFIRRKKKKTAWVFAKQYLALKSPFKYFPLFPTLF